MRPVVLILSIATLTFAGTTVYFAREAAALSARSAEPRAAALTTPVVTVPADPADARESLMVTPPPSGVVAGATSANVAMPMRPTDADIRRMQADYSRQVLARLDEPQGRDEMRAEHRLMFRNMYPSLDRFLGLSADEHVALLNLMADQQIGLQEKHARCIMDSSCSLQSLSYSGESHGREVGDFLGEDRARKFDAYRNTLSEREAVSQLRNRLPENSRLSPDAAEHLIIALAEERAALHREAVVSGNGIHSYGLGAGMLFAPAEGSVESRHEGARQNSQRLRDRAAQHLDSEQMRVFNEVQDELLVNLRGLLRHKGTFSAVTIPMPASAAPAAAVIAEGSARRAN